LDEFDLIPLDFYEALEHIDRADAIQDVIQYQHICQMEKNNKVKKIREKKIFYYKKKNLTRKKRKE